MTDDKIALRALLEKGSDSALVHEEIVGCVSPLDCPLSGSGR